MKLTKTELQKMIKEAINEALIESSRRDNIDADRDDKVEKARRAFNKRRDSADADRDYKLKKAGLKEAVGDIELIEFDAADADIATDLRDFTTSDAFEEVLAPILSAEDKDTRIISCLYIKHNDYDDPRDFVDYIANDNVYALKLDNGKYLGIVDDDNYGTYTIIDAKLFSNLEKLKAWLAEKSQY